MPHAFEHVHRAADIGIESLLGIVVGAPHQCLGREVKHEFGLSPLKKRPQRIVIAYIAILMLDTLRESQNRKVIVRPLSGQRVSENACPGLDMPVV